MSLYQLRKIGKFKASIDSKIKNPKQKSVGEELGILRAMLELVLEQAETEADLVARAPAVSDMVDKISKLVTSAQRLDMATGETLDKTQLAIFADKLTSAVAEVAMPDDSRIKLQERIVSLAKEAFDIQEQPQPLTTQETPDPDLLAQIEALDAYQSGDDSVTGANGEPAT